MNLVIWCWCSMVRGEVRGMRHTAYYCCFLIVVAANLYVAGIL